MTSRSTANILPIMALYGGVNNLFDQKPAFGYEDYPASGIGRYVYVGAKVMTDRLF